MKNHWLDKKAERERVLIQPTWTFDINTFDANIPNMSLDPLPGGTLISGTDPATVFDPQQHGITLTPPIYVGGIDAVSGDDYTVVSMPQDGEWDTKLV